MVKLSDIKNWDVELERSITSEWKKKELFKFNPKTSKKIYSIDTPPPYVNSPIHMGHAVTYSFMDFFARFKRMTNHEVLFPLGLDRNGLPIETAAEKKYNISPFREGRQKFVEACKKLLEESSTESIDSFAKLGISFSSYLQGEDLGSVYHTDSPKYRALTQSTFVELFKKGLIYEDTRVNNWDTKLQTTIADSEIDYVELESTFNYCIWKVKETSETIIIATTRPELISTASAVIFNPKDKKYSHLNGKTAISPIYGLEVPIMPHHFAKEEKGSGLVMMCAGGDLTDLQFIREVKLKPIIAINPNGTMNSISGILSGLKVKDARVKIIETLKEKGLLDKQEKIIHRTPISERSKSEIEFIEMPEFYLKQIEFKNDLKKISKSVNFYPENSKKILDSWIDSVSIDWPISRRRYYATPVPLWYCDDLVAFVPDSSYMEPWKESPANNCEVFDKTKNKIVGFVLDFPNKVWVGDTRVLDTWFDSSISELNMLHYKTDNDFFKKAYPASLRPQGKEIVRTWLYYTLLRGFLETKKACFNDVWIHQHILDSQGRKMSKSLGNVINPQDILNSEGSEALRLWASTEGDLARGDFSCSIEKIKAEKKTLNKLLNIAKFVLMFEKPLNKPKITKLDQVFIDYIEEITLLSKESYEVYNFNEPAQKLRFFLWEVFASNYLELVKARAYNENKSFSQEESLSAKYSLHFLLERLLLLFYPIIPQITTLIANEKGIDLLNAKWPKSSKKDSGSINLIEKIISFNALVWKAKKDANISLKNPISNISIPKDLLDFKLDLKACHNLE